MPRELNLLFWWLTSNRANHTLSSSRRHTIRDSQKTEALQNGEVSTVAVVLPPRTSINVHDLSEFISGERAMAGAMRTCATTASLTSLAPPRIASAANRRALPSIPLRPASSRTPRRGVSWSPPPPSSVSDIETAVVASPPALEQDSAAEVVRRFYGGINSRDLSAVEGLIADKCVYEDLVFPRPFVGREAILDFFGKFSDIIGTDLRFVIDDISEEDSSGVGVTWHLEWKGKPFPFSKGCSFYRLEVINGKRQIIYGRDSVEPALKPGETALVAIRGVVGLLQRFPQLADWL
ncbi:uncharacterized protein LOC115686816 [Syzygium oleosum]|uniref:uncharacterized protein LOC115686816 n=1 Tax=Syzygium oleosum TaxID=219896 RepID=UPI0024BB7C11|nr:uncharacterized protein LOC115686816 [Syzygium oleosum]